jgi:hypothetical protein
MRRNSTQFQLLFTPGSPVFDATPATEIYVRDTTHPNMTQILGVRQRQITTFAGNALTSQSLGLESVVLRVLNEKN